MTCPHCGSSQFIPGEAGEMTRTNTCLSCGRPYKEQPSPTQGEMGGLNEVRDMPGPGTEEDPGGNPLQEGIFKGNLGWKNREVRDESFASVRQSQAPGWLGDDYSYGIPGEQVPETINTDLREPTRSFLMTPEGKVFDAPYGTHHEDIANSIGGPAHLDSATLGHFHDDGSAQIVGHNNDMSQDQVEGALTNHYGIPVTAEGNFVPRAQNLGVPSTGIRGDIPYPWWEAASPNFNNLRMQEQQSGPFGYYDNPYFNRGGSVEPLDQTVIESWLYD